MMRQFESDGVARDAISLPPWNVVLRSLREASGVTQEGWAAHLGYGRRTLQRWERGDNPPDAAATEELVKLCASRGLYRTYQRGSLAGVTITGDLLRGLISDARLHRNSRASVSEQVSHADTRAVLNIVRDLSLPRHLAHNLPVEITSFIGRDKILSDVVHQLDRSSLVTLAGTGGVGKTRLALRAAAGLIDGYVDGVWFVRLETIENPALVAQIVAATVGVREQPGQPIESSLEEYLRDRQLLIVLDNCEHVVESCATLAARLLSTSQGLRILTTSREPLGVPGEVVVRVPSLTVSDAGSTTGTKGIVASDAVQLFVERAEASRPDFELTRQNADAVVQICRRLDGIPLSIELAAAWVRVLTPAEIDTRLNDRFRLLSGGTRATPSRHRTLQAAIDWSYNLLAPDERQLFDRLSIFAGPFSLAAVEHVCAWGDVAEVLQPLARLVEKSLVIATTRETGRETEYRLLDTLRDYADARLRQRNEYDELRRRHAEWICILAEQLSTAIHGPDQRAWLNWVMYDDANIRAALKWAIDQQDSERALRIAVSLWWPWGVLGRPREVRNWLDRVLALPYRDSRPLQVLRAHAMSALGTVSVLQGDITAARSVLAEAMIGAIKI